MSAVSTRAQRNAAQSPPVTDESRGEAIKSRRLDLGYKTPTAFAKATGKDWETIERAESGHARRSTYDFLEQWLAREEAEASLPVGGEAAAASGSIRITLHGVYGIEEIILDGSADRPEALAKAYGLLLEQIKQGDNPSPVVTSD